MFLSLQIDVVNHTTDYIRELESTLLAQLLTQQQQQQHTDLASKLKISSTNNNTPMKPQDLLKIIRERVKDIVLEKKARPENSSQQQQQQPQRQQHEQVDSVTESEEDEEDKGWNSSIEAV